MSETLLEVAGVVRDYALPRTHLLRKPPVVQALKGVSLSVRAGRNLGIVGESGSGKSTLARIVMALDKPTSGTVRLLGQDLFALDATALRHARRDFQMVFQDPYGSLDPRQTVERIVCEPLAAQRELARRERHQRATQTLESVGLRAADLSKYAHEFSGGQRQRIAIARALITRPKLIIADEPLSALDVSVQAQVLNLMADLQREFGVTFLFISHDIAVVSHLCADVAVMRGGLIVEVGPVEQVLDQPREPYTRALLAAVPAVFAARR